MELSNYLVSWVVTYLGDLQPTYIWVFSKNKGVYPKMDGENNGKPY